MAFEDNKTPAPDHLLPLPEEQRGRVLGDTFSDPGYAERQRLAQSFADPNALDDTRLGKSFEETNSSARKKHHVHIHTPPAGSQSRRRLWVFVIVVLLVFLLVFFVGWLPRHNREKETQRRSEALQHAKPVVEVLRVQRETTNSGLVVPGTTAALTEASIYARANGYLKARFVDIGDRVRKGQLLAIIEAPDLDQQVDQAREQVRQAEAQLAQQRAQLGLATVTVQRYRVLVAKGVFSRQEGDQREADYGSQVANVGAAERNVEAFRANLRRALALQSFERVTAPFDGVITQRTTDIGALISANGSGGAAPSSSNVSGGASNNAGSSGSINSSATPSGTTGQGGALFGIAQAGRLRILVSVPGGYASSIHSGATAHLAFQEYPQRTFSGQVTRTSGSIDPNTRTLLTEIQVDNKEGLLLPGMYAVATFPGQTGAGPLLIPGDAIAVRRDQSVVAVVGADGKVHISPVNIGRDFGASVEIASGLKEGDLLVTNVTDEIREGAPVTVHQQDRGKTQQNQAPTNQPAPPGGSSQYGNQGATDENMQGKQSQQNQKGGGQKPAPSKQGSRP